MDKKTTVFLAKKLFTELVFNTAYIEGVNVTFPQTQTILDGGIVNQVPVSDIQTVLNLRDAWRYCINNFESTIKSTKWSLAMKAWLGEACEQEKLASAEQNICLKYPGKMK